MLSLMKNLLTFLLALALIPTVYADSQTDALQYAAHLVEIEAPAVAKMTGAEYERRNLNSKSKTVIAYYSIKKEIIYYSSRANEITMAHELGHHLFIKSVPTWNCDTYVSKYAETNLQEDIAESFALYVLAGQSFKKKAAKDQCLQKKYDFFKRHLGKEYKGRIICPRNQYSLSQCRIMRTGKHKRLRRLTIRKLTR